MPSKPAEYRHPVRGFFYVRKNIDINTTMIFLLLAVTVFALASNGSSGDIGRYQVIKELTDNQKHEEHQYQHHHHGISATRSNGFRLRFQRLLR